MPWAGAPTTSPLLQDGAPLPARRAFFTLITRDSYLMGVQGLQRSLVLVGARHPLLVMYTPDTLSRAAAEALRREGCSMRAVNRYTPPPSEKCVTCCDFNSTTYALGFQIASPADCAPTALRRRPPRVQAGRLRRLLDKAAHVGVGGRV